jgi:RNA polymerase sigma-70 factor (ECF subfamily)
VQSIDAIAGRHLAGLEDPAGAAPCDSELVRGAMSGDRGAWAVLYSRYAPMVHGILLSRVGKQEADDLTQDVFVQAMKRLGDVRDGAAVGAWLAAIARNAGVSACRRVKAAALVDESIPAREEKGPEAGEAARVMAVIRQLPDAYRETLVLRLVEGLTGPQIAERMGMTHGSVRVNLHRGMQMLREKLGGEP